MFNFSCPKLERVRRQLHPPDLLKCETCPFYGGLQIAFPVLIMFGKFNKGIEMTLLCGRFPQTDRLNQIPAFLLQDGQPPRRDAEICFIQPRLESTLEQTRSLVPVPKIFEELAQRNEIQAMLD